MNDQERRHHANELAERVALIEKTLRDNGLHPAECFHSIRAQALRTGWGTAQFEADRCDCWLSDGDEETHSRPAGPRVTVGAPVVDRPAGPATQNTSNEDFPLL